MLGFVGGEVVVEDQATIFGPSEIRPLQMTNVRCDGTEKSIFECPMKVDVKDDEEGCRDNDYLGIICQ